MKFVGFMSLNKFGWMSLYKHAEQYTDRMDAEKLLRRHRICTSATHQPAPPPAARVLLEKLLHKSLDKLLDKIRERETNIERGS